MSPRRRSPAVVVLVLVLSVVAGCGGGAPDGGFSFVAPGGQSRLFYDPPAARGRAPVLSGDSVTEPGRTISTDDYPGRVVVINVWGSWCGPCRAETPELERVFEQTRALGVQLFGVDVRDQRSAAADFIRDRAVTYPSIYDPPGRSLIALRGYPRNVVPSTIVLDREHRVAAVFLTALTQDDLLPVVRRLAAEPVPGAAGAEGPAITGAPALGADGGYR